MIGVRDLDMESLGELLESFVSDIIITDIAGLVLWHSKSAKDKFAMRESYIKFNDKFNIGIELIRTNRNLILNVGEIDYRLIYKELLLENENLSIIIFEDINSFKNKDTRIYMLESIIENLNDGIVASDFDGKIVVYNNAMEKLEGTRSENMINEYLWDAYGYGEKNLSEHRDVFESGEALINKYSAHSYSDGVPMYVSYSTYPVIKDGKTIGVYTISKNETKLHSLLSETVELKRKFNKEEINGQKNYYSNGTSYTFSDIIGTSGGMINLIREAQSLAWLDNNILIIGETGTGKEVLAQSIHNYGKRSNQPFIGINCSAIPENLLESILFGTVRGAFTGAMDHSGLFEEAKEGTLFLDEMNSMPMSMQTKLLRVLQERIARPVGGNKDYFIKCRIISAMNEDPIQLIKNGTLREDLFYRIAGFNLYIPPLRERSRDIFDLSDYYISRLNKEMNRNVLGISKELKEIMKSYNWPGNVRELQHFIENLMVRVSEGEDYLKIKDIPDYIKKRVVSTNEKIKIGTGEDTLPKTLDNIETKIIIDALEENNWNISKTSRELGIIRQSLLYRIKRLEIERKSNV